MEKEIKLTEEQKIVLEFYRRLGAEWLATDKDGTERFYVFKPKIRNYSYWVDRDRSWMNGMQIHDKANGLKLVAWEDEPLNIYDLLGMERRIRVTTVEYYILKGLKKAGYNWVVIESGVDNRAYKEMPVRVNGYWECRGDNGISIGEALGNNKNELVDIVGRINKYEMEREQKE